ncbi:MAG: hypothetical protein SPH02_07690, partial [Campylobacter sp.]|nr:hypothetical protein [Campylobacter sp.]
SRGMTKVVRNFRIPSDFCLVILDFALGILEFGDAGNLVLGANIAGFRKVAAAMIKQGYV